MNVPKVGSVCPFATLYRPVTGDSAGFLRSHHTSLEQKLSQHLCQPQKRTVFPGFGQIAEVGELP